jgi:hypothetical protein
MKNLILLLMLLSLNAVWAKQDGQDDSGDQQSDVLLRNSIEDCNSKFSNAEASIQNEKKLTENQVALLNECHETFGKQTRYSQATIDDLVERSNGIKEPEGPSRSKESTCGEGDKGKTELLASNLAEVHDVAITALGEYRAASTAIGEHIEVKYCGSGADLAIEFARGLDAVKTKLNADTSDDGEVVLWNNPNMKCEYKGGLAIDYKDCKQIVNKYNQGFIAEQGFKVAGEAQRIGAQRNAAQQAADPNNLQTGALDAMGTVIEKEKSIQTQMAGFYTAYAGVIGGYLIAWKTPKWLESEEHKCATELDEVSCKALEDVILGAGMEGYYFPNQGYKGHFTAEMIKHAGNSTMHGVLAGQYKKAGDDIDKAKEDVYDLQQREQDLIGLDDCVANPDQPGCNGSGGGRRQIEGVEFGGIEFGGGANSAFNPQALDSGSGGITGNRGTISDADASSIASGLENFADKGASAPKDVAPGAAASKFGGNGGGAGGGGGGGGGGGAAPGLSNINRGGGSKDSGIKIGSSSMKFGKGGFATGGRGAAKSNKNPFSGLLGKKKGKKGGVKVERGLASGIDAKGSKLFEKISKRYGKVIKDNRLEKSDKKL